MRTVKSKRMGLCFSSWQETDLEKRVNQSAYSKEIQTDNMLHYDVECSMCFELIHYVTLVTRFCPTYPKLHIVPAIITDKEMEAVVKFRTSGRFPSVVWR